MELYVEAQSLFGGQVLIGPGEDVLKLDQVCGAGPQGGEFGHQRFHGTAHFCHVLLGALNIGEPGVKLVDFGRRRRHDGSPPLSAFQQVL